MKLCRVTGNVVATVKHPTYRGHKLMIVQPLDENQVDVGSTFLAVDLAQAGPGDVVLVMQEGNGVRQILKEQKLPIRSIIIGIVDAVTLQATSGGGGNTRPSSEAQPPRAGARHEDPAQLERRRRSEERS